MAVKKGLGRGLDILIPKEPKNTINNKKDSKDSGSSKAERKSGLQETKSSVSTADYARSNNTDADEQDDSGNKAKDYTMLDINIIEPNRNQPRKQFDDEGIEELADSIRKYGLIQPLLVQKKGDYYEIIAGERRWRASKEADLKKVPVIIKDYSDSEALKVSLIENLQRENLNAIEEAQAYQILKKEYGLKQDEIASSVSKSRAAITNTMRLLKLDERIQNLIVEDQITSGHGRALLAIADKEVQYKAALKIRDDNLSVREAERLVKKILDQFKEEDNPKEKEKNENYDLLRTVEERLKEIIGSKVIIKSKNNDKGKIEIDYYSKEEFERIIEFLQK